MPLEMADPPMLAYEAVRSRMTDLAAAAAFGTPALRRAAPDALALSTPHRVAVLPFDRIGSAMSLSRCATIKGWRFLVHSGEGVVASADAIAVGAGRYRFGQINEGPFVAGTEQAIRRAETDARLKKGRYEPVLLMVPALHVVALWLRDADDGAADQVIVIAPAPGAFRPFEAVSHEDFAVALAELARGERPEGSRA